MGKRGRNSAVIGTVSLNPCIDKTLLINGFTYGGMNRVVSKRSDVSGKGINVSIVLKQLGFPVETLGLNYAVDAEYFSKQLESMGIEYRCVLTPGSLRENVKILDESTHTTTEINQKGEPVSAGTLSAFDELLNEYLPKLSILVVTGSVPAGVDSDCYRRIIIKAKTAGVKTILDAEGELLLRGIEAAPYMIKPNLYELESGFGVKIESEEELFRLCDRIIGFGVELVCVSLGADGAYLIGNGEAYRCRPAAIDVKSTQGAGDSMVAGIAIGLESGLPKEQLLSCGVAAAQGSLLRMGTQLCTKDDFEYFRKIIKTEKRR